MLSAHERFTKATHLILFLRAEDWPSRFCAARVKLGPGAMSAQCPNYFRKQPCSGHQWTSQKCQFRPRADAATPRLFDHLVGTGEQRRRHLEAEGRSRLQVDHEFKLDRVAGSASQPRFSPLSPSCFAPRAPHSWPPQPMLPLDRYFTGTGLLAGPFRAVPSRSTSCLCLNSHWARSRCLAASSSSRAVGSALGRLASSFAGPPPVGGCTPVGAVKR
jgi:hypothetical protein